MIFETDTFAMLFWNGSAWQGAVSAPAGTVNPYAGSTAPTGWLLSYGQAVSRTTYANLFAVLSTTYGVGDGSTTFNLPDLRGRVVAGEDDMGGTAASRLTAAGSGITGTTLGATGGTQTHTMTSAEMPSHTHTQNAHSHSLTAPAYGGVISNVAGGFGAYFNRDGVGGSDATNWQANSTTPTNQDTGGGGAHQNTQPTIVLNYIIKF
jgi:microcystin-dependent protein